MKKTILAAAIISIFSIQHSVCQGQEHSNYLGLDLGGGIGTALYSPAHGDRSIGLGFGAGLHYAHFFGRHFGLGFGVNYSRLAASTTYDFTETTTGLSHASNPGVTYDLSTTFDGWRERQAMGLLGIPVEFFWRTPLGRHALIVGLGAQFELPLHASYTANEGAYVTTGYFPSIGHSVGDLPQHGFSAYDADFQADIENLKPSVSLLADLGLRFALGGRWGFYAGLYASYGITGTLDEVATDPLLKLSDNSADEIVYNGTFASAEVDGAHLLRVGLKLGLDLGWNCHSRQPEPVAEEPVLVPVQQEEPQVDEAAREEARRAAEKAEAERKALREAQERAEAERRAAEARKQEEARQAAAARADLKGRVEGMVIAFDFGGSEPRIRTEDDLVLRALCAAMQADPSLRVTVTGHTDNVGPADANMRLGMERAQAVRQRMTDLGVPAANIASASRGEEQPVDTNDTPEGRARNRRVVVAFE